MKIMLDLSEAQICDREERFDMRFMQLRTPLTRNRLTERGYGLDNGCFTKFERKTWYRMVNEARSREPVFVTLPDVVGSARRTLELFEIFAADTIGLPRALVLQDGIGEFAIPWGELSAVFVGGSDQFKFSPECVHACKAARILGKWVHVGRVNTVKRLSAWSDLADSIDGSGISKHDHMLEKAVYWIKNADVQQKFGFN